MNKEDYFKYYIQGLDHYLIPKDIFNELFEDYECFKNDCKKYKEVIDRAIKYIENTYYSKNTTDIDSIILSNDKLLKIRKILKCDKHMKGGE